MKHYVRFGFCCFFLVGSFSAWCADTNQTQVTTSSAAQFDRLFTRASERKALDDIRQRGGLKKIAIEGEDKNALPVTDAAVPVLESTDPIKLSGILWRADGKHTVWLNGSSNSDASHQDAHLLRGDPAASATVNVPVHSGAILKPGQVWIPAEKRKEESYQLPQAAPIVAQRLAEPNGIPQGASSTTASSSSTASSVQASSANASETSQHGRNKAFHHNAK